MIKVLKSSLTVVTKNDVGVSASFRFFWKLSTTNAVKIGKNTMPEAARITASDWPNFVTPKMLEPTVVTFINDQLKASQ